MSNLRKERGVNQSFHLEALSPSIGGEVSDIDLASDLDDDAIAGLRQALLDRKVLFFRDQEISTEQHIAFARRFGTLETHPFTDNHPEHPEVIVLANGPANKSRINVWHSDVTWRREPSLGSVLRAREVPDVGGDTLFADMEAAYDSLPEELRQRLDGLEAEHDFMRAFGARLSDEKRAAMREQYPIATHPVVRTHPETGRKSLYVNAGFTVRILGLEAADSEAMLRRLYALARVPEFQVRFRWRKNSIAFWDNRGCQHYPVSDYHPAVRVMERVTIVGDRPV
jgi:taurine dioxygenase